MLLIHNAMAVHALRVESRIERRRIPIDAMCPDKVEVVKSIAGDAPRPVATFPCQIRQQATARVMVCTQHLS